MIKGMLLAIGLAVALPAHAAHPFVEFGLSNDLDPQPRNSVCWDGGVVFDGKAGIVMKEWSNGWSLAAAYQHTSCLNEGAPFNDGRNETKRDSLGVFLRWDGRNVFKKGN